MYVPNHSTPSQSLPTPTATHISPFDKTPIITPTGPTNTTPSTHSMHTHSNYNIPPAISNTNTLLTDHQVTMQVEEINDISNDIDDDFIIAPMEQAKTTHGDVIQPVFSTTDNNIFTRLTMEGPFYPPQVQKIMDTVSIGPLNDDKQKKVCDLLCEFTDIFTLSV